MRELTMSALPSQSCWTVVLIALAAYHSFHDANFFNLNMHISNPWGPTRWSVSFPGCGVWATSRFGYLALCFKRGCETILNVMVPGWSQIVFGCVWLCHCYLNLRCLRTEIDEFLGPRISHNLACFRLWVILISVHLEKNGKLKDLVCAPFCYVLPQDSDFRYVRIIHPDKDKKDQLREQFATALMIQYFFGEVEWTWDPRLPHKSWLGVGFLSLNEVLQKYGPMAFKLA